MKTTISLAFLFFPLLINAQLEGGGAYLGFRLGVSNSLNIDNIPSTIIPSRFSAGTYNIENYGNNTSLTGGLTFIFQFADVEFFGFQADINFAQYQGGYHYDEKDYSSLNYETTFKYLYSSLFISPKFNYKGVFLKPGIGFGLNLSPENIEYTHSPEDTYGPSEYVEEEMQLFLKGKNYLGYSFALGYEFLVDDDKALGFEIRHQRSFGDVLEAKANPYEWSSRPDNKLQELWAFSIYFALPTN